MLNKTKLIIAVASVLITGVGATTGAYIATRNNDTGAVVSSEVVSMASKTVSIDTSPIDAAVSAGVEQIESVVASAIQKIESKAAGQSSVASVESKVESKTPEPIEIPLNVETERGDGTLTFIKAETRPNQKQIKLYYETSDEKAKMPSVANGVINTTLTGKSGNKYYTDSFGGIGNKGDVIFDNITDYSDLSTVTLTYAFEGFDPVTVTFDIPLE